MLCFQMRRIKYYWSEEINLSNLCRVIWSTDLLQEPSPKGPRNFQLTLHPIVHNSLVIISMFQLHPKNFLYNIKEKMMKSKHILPSSAFSHVTVIVILSRNLCCTAVSSGTYYATSNRKIEVKDHCYGVWNLDQYLEKRLSSYHFKKLLILTPIIFFLTM